MTPRATADLMHLLIDWNVMAGHRRKKAATNAVTYNSLEPRLLLAIDALPADIVGTEGIDIIEVVMESDNVRVTVNNDVTNFDHLLFDKVVIDGGGGRDRITIIDETGAENSTVICPDNVFVGGLVDIYANNVEDIVSIGGDGVNIAQITGSILNEKVNVGPTTTFLSRGNFTARVIGFEKTYINAVSGTDRAYITDTAGEETLIASPHDARIIYADSFVAMLRFDAIYATFSEGNDLVSLNGSNGEEQLYATPDLVRMFSAETQAEIRVTGFGRVIANGFGGIDRLDLIDSPGADQLFVRPGFVNWTTPNVVFNISNYETVGAISNNGGRDIASVLDTDGDDKFHVGPNGARMLGSDYSVNLINFEKIDAIASLGNDLATTSDFVGENRFFGRRDSALLFAPDATFSMANFDRVIAAGNLAENDTAFMLTGLGNDEFFGALRESEFGISTSSLLIGGGSLISLTDFLEVKVASAGGQDAAYLNSVTSDGQFEGAPDTSSITGPRTSQGLTKLTVESFNKVIGSFNPVAPSGSTNYATVNGSGGDDELFATRHLGILKGTLPFGDSYSIVVNRADYFSSNGNLGNDSAIFRDTNLDETVSLTPGRTAMSALDGVNNGGYDLLAFRYKTFRAVMSGGYDTGSFTGTTGNDIFFANSIRTSMRGDGYHLQGVGFDFSSGRGSSGSNDIAYLYDSIGDDRLTGQGNKAMLRGPGYVRQAFEFKEVHAVSISGGLDVLNVGVIDYQLFEVGNWI